MLLYLIGLPTALVLGIMGNLLTPMARKALVARSTKRRNKRIMQIREGIKLVERLRAEPSAAAAFVGRRLMLVVALFTLVAAINTVALVLLYINLSPITLTRAISAIALVLLLYVTFIFTRETNFCKAIYAREWYVRKTAGQLRELGVKPPSDAEADSAHHDSDGPSRLGTATEARIGSSLPDPVAQPPQDDT
jgi:hypothetical protein